MFAGGAETTGKYRVFRRLEKLRSCNARRGVGSAHGAYVTVG